MARKATVKLKRAERIDPPFFEKESRNKFQMAGLAYEKRVFENLREQFPDEEVLHGPWFRYYDKFTGPNGAIAQPDIIIVPKDPALPLALLECKLCYKPDANRKLDRLYRPIVQYVYPDRRILTSQIFRSVPRDHELTLDARLRDLYEDMTWEHRDILEII